MTCCKDCKYFERGKWHHTQGRGEQLGGNCQLLLDVLKIDNSVLFFEKNFQVQDTFGCIMGKEKNNIAGEWNVYINHTWFIPT